MNTTDDYIMTLLRLALGIVFFAHGAQKVLGWFGGFGFRATLGFFNPRRHIPPGLGRLALPPQFPGGTGLPVGFFGPGASFWIAINMRCSLSLFPPSLGS